MCWIKKTIAFLVLSLNALYANTQINNIELWSGPAIRYRFLNRFRLEFEQQIRFSSAVSGYDMTFSELGLRFDLAKSLYVKPKFRYSFIPEKDIETVDEEYDRRRISFDLGLRTKLWQSSFKVGYRMRFQDTREHLTEERFTYLRNRLELSYNLSKLADPFISCELFYRFNQRNEIRKYRYKAGVEWRLRKNADLNTFFAYQPEVNVKNPVHKRIIGIMLTIDLK